MIIDGQLIARELRNELRERVHKSDRRLSLAVIVAHDTPEIHTFVAKKLQFGQDIGVNVQVIQLGPLEQKNEKLLQLILHTTKDHDGIVLQLPLPPSFDINNVLSLFPLSHDVDVIGNTAYEQHREGKLAFLPPVVAAMAEILHRQGVRLQGRSVLVVGEGRLVGAPAAVWAQHVGGTVTVANKSTTDLAEKASVADVIILGAGSPGLLTPNMVKQGAIILDAGTSDQQGVLKGDADPACAEKATVFTPTPGGIGPITVAKVFENLLTLVNLKAKRE